MLIEWLNHLLRGPPPGAADGAWRQPCAKARGREVNWLGASLRAFLAALLGAALGAALAQHVARRYGLDLPPLVGMFTGAAAAAASRGKSGLRGMLVASLAVWAAAIAEVAAAPSRGLSADLAGFHERLRPIRVLAYVACAAVAGLLGSRAPVRRDGAIALRPS